MTGGMADPVPENITGEKVEKHTFSHDVHHRVNWGYVSVAVAALALAYVLSQRLDVDDDSEDTDGLGVSA